MKVQIALAKHPGARVPNDLVTIESINHPDELRIYFDSGYVSWNRTECDLFVVFGYDETHTVKLERNMPAREAVLILRKSLAEALKRIDNGEEMR